MLRLRTFGGAALLEDDTPLDGPAAQRRRLALLAMLAVAGDRGLSRDKLATSLWPESDQERARHSLSQWMFTTRRDLRCDDLFLGGADVRLNAERFTSDVAEFERALAAGDPATAVACYAGPFLDGFHVPGASEFERWVDGERERLARMHHRALERLAGERTAAGDLRGAADAWRRLAAADPYSAPVALGLMRALAATGDAAAAIAHARVHATLVREELGAEPQPEVAELAERLRAAPGEFRSVMPPSPAGGAPAADARVEPGPLEPVPVEPAPVEPGAVGPGFAAPAGGAAAPVTVSRRRALLRRVAAFAAPAVLVGAVGAFTLIPPDTRAVLLESWLRRPATLSPQLVVVAPLENRTRDTSLAWFGELAAELIANELARAEGVSVVNTMSTRLTLGVVDRLPRIVRPNDRRIALGREAGAELVMAGTYFRLGDSLHVTVQLVDVATGRVVRSMPALAAPAEGEGRDALLRTVVQRAVALAVSTADTSDARGIGIAPPPSLAAYAETRGAWQEYLAGRPAAFYARVRRAMAIDSGYMMPVAIEAHLRAESREWARVDSLVRVLQAHRTGLSPLELAATDMFAAAIAGDLAAHLQGARNVVRAAPGAPETRTYAARVAVNANRPQEALAILRDVDPSRGVMLVRPWYWTWMAAAQHELGAYREEARTAARELRRFPREYMSVATYGRTLAVDGDVDGLRELLGRLPDATSPDGQRRWKIALDWTRELRAHGHGAEARALLETIRGQLTQPSLRGYWVERFRATVEGDLGRVREAHARWQRLASAHPADLDAIGLLAVSASRVGDRRLADSLDARIAAWEEPYLHGRDVMWRARIAAARGDADGAVRAVAEAFARGYPRFFDPGGGTFDEPEVHADPAFESLWRTARLRELLGG